MDMEELTRKLDEQGEIIHRLCKVGILPDHLIRELGVFTPYSPMEKRPGVITYGESHMGYDLRIGYKFKVFTNVFGGRVDPKRFGTRHLVEIDLTPNEGHDWVAARYGWYQCSLCGSPCSNIERYGQGKCPAKVNENGAIQPELEIPPHSFVLGESLEECNIPRDIQCICLGKSTYARCGLIANVTPLEPGWKGKVTIEVSNTTSLPAVIYPGEGIIQVLLFRSYYEVETDYAQKKGKYQSQVGLTLPKVD